MKVEERLSKYELFIKQNYVPVYSQPWWMDAVCGPDNWDVWLYEKGGKIFAAMPYYFEMRGPYKYITKAPLTQNNGIIFSHPEGAKLSQRAKFEEEVINEACKYIESLGVDVYEQQFQTSFTNWSPFYWQGYEAIPRYTYVLDRNQLDDIDTVWRNIDKTKRNDITFGNRNCIIKEDLDPVTFYHEVEKVYEKHNDKVPFSFDLWMRLYDASVKNKSGKIIYAENHAGELVSSVYYASDKNRMYQLIGGGGKSMQHYEGHSAIIWHAIQECANKNLIYDFEGSMIERVAKVDRLYGAIPMQYFRIRKVFNQGIK